MHLRLIESSDTLTFAALEGSLNLAGAEEIGSTFRAEITSPAKPTILDFSGVDFIASMGMRLLVEAAKALGREKRPLIILRPQSSVEKVIDSAGLTNILSISHDETDARRLANG